MRTALVIGGTGLIGRAVARHLLRDGWRVTVRRRVPRSWTFAHRLRWSNVQGRAGRG
ncbi:NAD-dependent epimerase/dehydratase family protein [Actinoplanes campanulatus]|uniref:NAD-dependent epimerase/dehydratase family protein n=1 Tax=Actinoplanes campanulatus TaxID=113559 RepID=UPI0016059AE7